mmetsp:Transcript_993/g.3430  ORF Transcript_993/g.3430 Transcript_993/m.3430 type:complete len:83 (+) Transcript_993:1814-2062(+)
MEYATSSTIQSSCTSATSSTTTNCEYFRAVNLIFERNCAQGAESVCDMKVSLTSPCPPHSQKHACSFPNVVFLQKFTPVLEK